MAIGPMSDRANLGSISGSPFATVSSSNFKGVTGDCWAYGTNVNKSTATCNGLNYGNGMFTRNDGTLPQRPTKLKKVTDGTSNTFLLGEDIPEIDAHCAWFYANGSIGTCAIPPNVMNKAGGAKYDPYNDWPELYSFRSRHPGGLNFGMVDGSIHFIRQDIPLPTYRALATIASGEAVAEVD
jgi:prepilin-type processing-associated H-X9-DG protein